MQVLEAPNLLLYEFQRLLATHAPCLQEQSPFTRTDRAIFSEWDNFGFAVAATDRSSSHAILGKWRRVDDDKLEINYSQKSINLVHEASMVLLLLVLGLILATVGAVTAVALAANAGLEKDAYLSLYWSQGWCLAVFLLPVTLKLGILYKKSRRQAPELQAVPQIFEDICSRGSELKPLPAFRTLGKGVHEVELPFSSEEFLSHLRAELRRRKAEGKDSGYELLEKKSGEVIFRDKPSRGGRSMVVAQLELRPKSDGSLLRIEFQRRESAWFENLAIDFLRTCSRTDREMLFPDLAKLA